MITKTKTKTTVVVALEAHVNRSNPRKQAAFGIVPFDLGARYSHRPEYFAHRHTPRANPRSASTSQQPGALGVGSKAQAGGCARPGTWRPARGGRQGCQRLMVRRQVRVTSKPPSSRQAGYVRSCVFQCLQECQLQVQRFQDEYAQSALLIGPVPRGPIVGEGTLIFIRYNNSTTGVIKKGVKRPDMYKVFEK